MKITLITSLLLLASNSAFADDWSVCQGTTAAGNKIDLRYNLNLDGSNAAALYQLSINGKPVDSHLLLDPSAPQSGEFVAVASAANAIVYVRKGGAAVVNFRTQKVSDLFCGGD